MRLTVPLLGVVLATFVTSCPSPSEPFPTDYATRWREARVPCQISHDHELRYVRVFAADAA